MSKHTPGPWEVDTQVESPCHCIVVAPTSSRWIASIGDRPLGEEGQDNARLIAAAPELLEALERATASLRGYANNYLSGTDDYDQEIKYIESLETVVAKARGG